MSQRTDILKAFDERLWLLFKKAGGSVEAVFRDHRVGGLRPWKVRPSYTVVDSGSRRTTPGDNESTDEVLAVRIVLHVCDTWEKESTQQQWSDRVELIKSKLHGRPGCGIEDIRFVRDEPIDVVFLSGNMQGDWIIDFDVTWFTEVDEFDEW